MSENPTAELRIGDKILHLPIEQASEGQPPNWQCRATIPA